VGQETAEGQLLTDLAREAKRKNHERKYGGGEAFLAFRGRLSFPGMTRSRPSSVREKCLILGMKSVC